jgi:hypothetical protein
MPNLIVDTADDVLVNLPSGKVKKDGLRTKMKHQKGVTCFASSMRKLSFFSADTNMDIYKGLKTIKKALEDFDPKNACVVAEKVMNGLNIPMEKIKSNNPEFLKFKKDFPGAANPVSFWEGCSETSKFFAMYFYLNKLLYSSLNIGESSWTPEQGPEGLMDTMRHHGAVLVTGKFGACFHGGFKATTELNALHTENRTVYGFKPNTYSDDSSWTHTVIIDQVKKVNGTYRVFFRDPYIDSIPGEKEPVFCLSYDNFLKRLYHLDSNPYQPGVNSGPFLLHSLKPEKLVDAPVSKETFKTKKNSSESTLNGLLFGVLTLLCYGAYHIYNNLASNPTFTG